MIELLNSLNIELEILDAKETGIDNMLERPIRLLSDRSEEYQAIFSRRDNIETMLAVLPDLKKSHTSWTRGYVSRKNPEGVLSKYDGKFGKGYQLLTPSWESTQYCYITYYVEEV